MIIREKKKKRVFLESDTYENTDTRTRLLRKRENM